MSTPNRLPELDQNLVSSDKALYYLQKIIKYDNGHTSSYVIGVWKSPDGDIDKVAQNAIRQEKEFCEYNNFVEPHTMTIRKVKVDIHSTVLEAMSEHFDSKDKPKALKCSNCNGNINYGDRVIVKSKGLHDKYFCCYDCLAEYEDAVSYSSSDDSYQYNKLFGIEDD